MFVLYQFHTETLRLHPPFPVTSRMCTKTYKIPDTDVIIEEGTTLLFSAIGLQYDPQYYEQPEQFIPERYSESHSSKSFVEMPNLVFGEGPRNCLGWYIYSTLIPFLYFILESLRVNVIDSKL